MREEALGSGKGIYLKESLDTWNVRARGSSARVFHGIVRHDNGFRRSLAVKFMRPAEIEYATPLFVEEVNILQTLCDVPGVMRMTELGYVLFDNSEAIPPDTEDGDGRVLQGEVHRYKTEETEQFLDEFDQYLSKGWLPYLGLRRSHPQDNLLLLCDKNLTRGRLFPVEKGIRAAICACEILEQAHERNIVYRDHKIVHYYWNAEQESVTMIDWNVGKMFPDGVPVSEIHHDLVLFAASALHYILTGRRHLNAPEVGPTRPEELEDAPEAFEPRWEYADRKRLNKDMREVLAKALHGAYYTATELKQDLQGLMTQHEG